MNLDAFRRALLHRQREAARITRMRLLGEDPDEGVLAELDAGLFSREQTGRMADDLAAAQGGPSLLIARSRLALALRLGPLSRLRPLDRALSRALRSGRDQEALDIAEQIEAGIAREGPGPAPARIQPHIGEGALPVQDREFQDSPAGDRGRHGESYLALSGRIRGEDLANLETGARDVLEGSAALVEDLFGRSGVSAGRAGEVRTGAPDEPASSRGRTYDDPAASSSRPESAGPRSRAPRTRREGPVSMGASRSFEACLAELLDDSDPAATRLGPAPGASDAPDPTSIRGAVLDLAWDLGLGRSLPLITFLGAGHTTPVIIEEDPPLSVTMLLPRSGGTAALAQALDGGGRAIEATLRSPSLSEEHRVAGNRAVSFAMGDLFASLAWERAPASMRGDLGPGLRRALRREIVGARLAASLFLARVSLLSGRRAASMGDAADEAAFRAPGSSIVPFEDEPLLDSADRLRGHMLFAGLRERFRTRFGNLWYREKAVGRILEEICEPGGSIVAAEIMTGLSLPAQRAEGLLETWREERQRFE